jgi:hypothetical protein
LKPPHDLGAQEKALAMELWKQGTRQFLTDVMGWNEDQISEESILFPEL